MNKNKIIKLLSAIVLLIALVFTSCSEKPQEGHYLIKGNVNGLDNGWVKLTASDYINQNEILIGDSVALKDGKFKLEGKVTHPDMVSLKINGKYSVSFIIENSGIEIVTDITLANKRDGRLEATITGSNSHDEFEKYQQSEDTLLHQEKYKVLNDLRGKLEVAYENNDKEAIDKYRAQFSELRELMNERTKERLHAKFKYVEQHTNSVVAPYVLGFQFGESRMTKTELKKYYALFDGEAKTTAMYAFYSKRYDDLFKKLAPGSKVPDFSLPTVDGEMITFSEVKGKYILVDFWASWCAPCRASFLDLKKMYAKYHKYGFEIVGIGTSDTEDRWRKALGEDKPTWINVFDESTEEKGKISFGSVAQDYGVPFLPTVFLIDENGIIIARQLKGEKLDKKLKELFSK